MARDSKMFPRRGSVHRPALDDQPGQREVLAVGGTSAALSVADAGAIAITMASCQEEGVADFLVLQSNAAVALVAGDGLAGLTLSEVKIGGNTLIGGGNVPATIFGAQSRHNPRIGIFIDSTKAITVAGLNNSGATVEVTAGVTIA